METGIPGDVINEILLWLPVKSLLRFKSVSKSWFSLISSPEFIKSHIRDDQTLIVLDYLTMSGMYNRQVRPYLYLFNLGTNCQRGADLYFPYTSSGSSLLGSARGIVCILSPGDSNYIYLWNPATKQSKSIPSCNTLSNYVCYKQVFGFGFDPIDNDFKIVRAVWPFSHEDEVCVGVYSANKNDWRKLEPKPIDDDIPWQHTRFDVCVNGLLCFSGLYDRIMTFDLNKEVLICDIKLPVTTFDLSITDFKDYVADVRITAFCDSIAIIISKRNGDNKTKINLWALDDEECCRGGGIHASWTLMINIDINLSVKFVHSYCNGGDLLLKLFAGDGWYFYNSDNKEARHIQGFGQSYYVTFFKYTESLVPIA